MKTHFFNWEGVQIIFGFNGIIHISCAGENYSKEIFENISKIRNIINILNDNFTIINVENIFIIYNKVK